MDIDQLKNSLTLEQIESILYALGSEEVDRDEGSDTIMTNTICHNEHGGKLKLWYNNNLKSFRCFTGCGGHNYTIFNLIIQVFSVKGVTISFTEALGWLKEHLGISDDISHKGFGSTVGGKTTDAPTKREELVVFELLERAEEKLSKEQKPLVYYNENHLSQFAYHGAHSSFTNDNISIDAMDKFSIMSDRIQNAMIIPHRYYKNGAIIGIISRNLNSRQIDKGFKYIPYSNSQTSYKFPKHQNLYGVWENRKAIQSLGKVSIFEAEKSVLQCESYYGERNHAVALGGGSLDDLQIDILIESSVKVVHICLDKDYESVDSLQGVNVLNNMVKMAKRLIAYFTVFIVYDSENLLEEKDSPSDKGVEVLNTLFERKELINSQFIETWEEYIANMEA